jgi:hypothetical protein
MATAAPTRVFVRLRMESVNDVVVNRWKRDDPDLRFRRVGLIARLSHPTLSEDLEVVLRLVIDGELY